MRRLLFVCLGNICRSPAAEGVFRGLAAQRGRAAEFEIDSAGTGDWHIGSPPDRRARRAALERGIDISGLRARQIQAGDFAYFDWVIGMDRRNRADLLRLAGEAQRHKVRLLSDYSAQWPGEEVPDPYYGGARGFDLALDLIEEACGGLLDHLTGPGA